MEKYTLKNLLKRYLNLTSKYTLNDLVLICANLLNKDKSFILINIDKMELKKDELDLIDFNLNKLINLNVPYQYILGYKDFYKERYFVNESVLIPREDTELLVSETIKYINTNNLQSMLDLCTGSGCIGISIANNSDIKEVLMVDISDDALKVANKNIHINKANGKCKTLKSDLFTNVDKENKFDILVSNPPYINTDVIASLDSDVKNEPYIALDGGVDGLNFYRRIFSECKNVLCNNSYILLEIGYDQKQKIMKLIEKFDYLEYINTLKDFSNNDRVVICRFHQI